MTAPLSLPSTTAMFPLPNVVLFPGQALPLHIFEDRYKEMVRHVLSLEEPLLGIQLYKKGWENEKPFPPTYSTACIGRVGEVENLPDGRCNLILHGLVRVEVQEYEQREPFRIAEIAPLNSIMPLDADLDPMMQSLAESVRRVLPIVTRGVTWDQVQPIFQQLAEPDAVSDFVAAYLPIDVHLRQDLLETLGVEERVQLVLSHLAGLLSVLN